MSYLSASDLLSEAPDRAVPVVFEVGQPVRCLDQRRPAAVSGPSETRAVWRRTKLDLLMHVPILRLEFVAPVALTFCVGDEVIALVQEECTLEFGRHTRLTVMMSSSPMSFSQVLLTQTLSSENRS